MDFTLIHRLFREFFTHASNEQCRAMVSEIKDVVPHILHTRDGAFVSAAIITHANAKERKHILRILRHHVPAAVADSHGVIVLCRALQAVDDTVISSKYILQVELGVCFFLSLCLSAAADANLHINLRNCCQPRIVEILMAMTATTKQEVRQRPQLAPTRRRKRRRSPLLLLLKAPVATLSLDFADSRTLRLIAPLARSCCSWSLASKRTVATFPRKISRFCPLRHSRPLVRFVCPLLALTHLLFCFSFFLFFFSSCLTRPPTTPCTTEQEGFGQKVE